jgi:hypothetical protein
MRHLLRRNILMKRCRISGYDFTDHALRRMAERNISVSMVEKILEKGDYEHNQGALVFSKILDGEKINLSVVIDGDTVVTVYRKTGRNRKRKNRKHKSWPGRRYTL